jgi:hypothetical protein
VNIPHTRQTRRTVNQIAAERGLTQDKRSRVS